MGQRVSDFSEDLHLREDVGVDQFVHRLTVDEFHQHGDLGPGPAFGADLFHAQNPPDRGMREFLGDLDFILGLNQKAIVFVAFFEEHMLQRKDLAAVWLTDAVDFAGGTGPNMLENSIPLDVIRLFHGRLAVQGTDSLLPHGEELGHWEQHRIGAENRRQRSQGDMALSRS